MGAITNAVLLPSASVEVGVPYQAGTEAATAAAAVNGGGGGAAAAPLGPLDNVRMGWFTCSHRRRLLMLKVAHAQGVRKMLLEIAVRIFIPHHDIK